MRKPAAFTIKIYQDEISITAHKVWRINVDIAHHTPHQIATALSEMAEEVLYDEIRSALEEYKFRNEPAAGRA